jgi:hypothetical protein
MMQLNLPILAASALIPMVMGFIWYNPKTLGTAWMNASGVTEEKMKGANMALIFGLSYVLAFFLATAVNFMVIHQFHLQSILIKEAGFQEAGTEINNLFTGFLERFGTNYRTFKHGFFHGTMAGLFVSLPILGTNALFERKGFKYIAINVGYWTVTLALMGGFICQFA